MRKEIQSLMSGKSLPFMSTIAEKLDVKAAAEYEIQKMKVAKTLIKEESELDEDFDGETLKPGQVKVTATSVKAKNKKGETRTWPWHSEYDDNEHINKADWFKDKKLKAQEFARG